MNNGIKISDLSVGYYNPLIENISVAINSSQLIAVIGRNGEGKSTLLKTLSGLLPALKGKFLYNDVNILSLPNEEKAKLLSIVTTTKLDIDNISVLDFIGFGRYPYTNWLGVNQQKDNSCIQQAIDLCKIERLINRNYNELSDGEKQRVNIARAIAQDTAIIILDEPTTHLDLINKIELLKLLKTLTQQLGKTIIFSSHMLEHVFTLADKIWLISDGQLINKSPNDLISDSLFIKCFSSKDVSYDSVSNTFKMI